MTDLIDIVLPADNAEGTTSVVATWFKKVGDRVAVNEPLLELSTDKVTVEIASPADGVLQEVLRTVDDTVQPGEVVGRIAGGGSAGQRVGGSEQPQGSGAAGQRGSEAGGPRGRGAGGDSGSAGRRVGESATEGGTEPADRSTMLSPAVRRLLQQHGLEADQVQGTGRGGRITAEDVEAAVASGVATASASRGAVSPTAPLPPRPAAPPSGIPSRMVPHTQMRKSIAAHMVHSVATAPHVTTVFDADLTKVLLHRERNRAEAEARGARLTLTAYFVQATVRALQAVPEVNSRWHDDALELFDDCNVGVGTALEDGGLIVPVIHQAQTLDLLDTANRLTDLTERARSGGLTPADVQKGTFTISNHGVSGSIIATPIIINQPQSAILGIGRMEKRVVVAQSYTHEVTEIRPMIYVTLTIDHRVLDGFQANRFLSEWVKVIEGWG